MHNFFTNLDDKALYMEETIQELEEENKKLHGQICEMHQNNMQASNAMIGNALAACLGAGRAMDAGTAVILANIRDMQNMDQVRAYIKEIGDNTLEHLKEKEA